MSAGIKDWTEGAEAIAWQACGVCRHVWYFRRGFCPSCGARDPQMHAAGGDGVVHAITIVRRAATPEARAHAPYAILLVDMAEGFRMMAHGDSDLAIGDRVTTTFRPFAGRAMPYFIKA
jgi:uncharacterized OB-fold protein